MYKVIFTSDYELHGGNGSPRDLLVEPALRMLELLDRYGAKLTLMADAGELLKFKQYSDLHGEDRFHWRAIEAQLRRAVRTGHDVQLQLNPSWFDATWDERAGKWVQDSSAYDLARLPYSRVRVMIRNGKRLLEDTCRVATPGYKCIAFRAQHWSMRPSATVVRALVDEGFSIDTSVWPGGRGEGLVRFDHSRAPSAVVPWPVSERNACERDPDGTLFEVPIYTERRPLWAFLTTHRLRRAIARRGTDHREERVSRSLRRTIGRGASMLLRAHPWRMDVDRCTGRELVRGLRRAEASHGHPDVPLPLVLVGRAWAFTKRTERLLRPFLEYVADHPERYGFSTFGELDLERYRLLRAPRADAAESPPTDRSTNLRGAGDRPAQPSDAGAT